MTTRKYSSRSQQTTLSAALTSAGTTATVVSGTSLLGGATVSAGQTFTVVIDPDTALEEIVDVTAVSTNTLTITRGIDGSSGVAHSAGAVVRHMAIGRDYREANEHIENTTTAHGVTLANVVKTTDTGTVTNAMLAGSIADSKLSTISTASKVSNSATTATSANTASAIVARDASGNFTAGTVTANLTGAVTGNASTATALATARNFQLTGDVEASAVSFDGTGNVSLTTAIGTGAIVNADVNASAAIDKTKISGTAITAADTGTVTSAMIANDTIVNADINSSAQIAYSKTNLTNSIVNADINASAAIEWTKIAPSSTVSSTELGYLDGVTSAIQTQLDSKLGTSTASSTYAPLASPALTGTPTAPTAAANTNTTQIATTAYVQTEINDLINSAPGALDTLDELAAALGDDASFATTVTNSLATKLPLAGGTMTGAIAMGTNKITGVGNPTSAQDAATKNYVDNVTVAPSNLTGPITSVGAATAVAAQTGTGSTFVMQVSPTLTTPNIGVATATSINGTTIPNSKTLVATDSTTYVVPSQAGNSGRYLTTDGSTSSWGAISGSLAQPSEPASPSDGLIWVDTDGTAPLQQMTRWSKAPAGGTTSLTGADDNAVTLAYTVGYEQVYRNGVLLSRGNDYTATNGTSITLTDATITGDIIEIFAVTAIGITDVYTQTQSNNLYVPKTLTSTTGDIIYASAANTPARLGIGSAGQVLTVASGVPSWATPASGGMTLLSTTTFNNTASTVTYSSLGSYKHLLFVGENISMASSSSITTLAMEYNAVSTGGQYVSIGMGESAFAFDSQLNLNGNYIYAAVRVVSNSTAPTSQRGFFHTWIYDYAGSTNKTNFGSSFNYNTSPSARYPYFNQGIWNNTAAITSIRLFTENASNFATGTIKLYGVS